MTGFLKFLRPQALLRVALMVMLVSAAVLASHPAGAAEETLSPAEVEAIQSVVRDYIREHPEIVGDALKKLVEKQRAEEAERRRLNIRALGKQLNHDPDSPVGGNEEGDVTLVEFFDYNCPYCKAVAPNLMKLIEEDKNLRFVFKEFPILGPVSTFAARAALASRKQGKYVDFHFALMTLRGRLSEAVVMRVAKQVGLDTDQLRSDMASPDIDSILKRNGRLAKGLEITGTPAFVIGVELIPGQIEISRLKALIEKARKG
ncbi:MAG: DsbA family protein [Alphaproteobacteria bacterium]